MPVFFDKKEKKELAEAILRDFDDCCKDVDGADAARLAELVLAELQKA